MKFQKRTLAATLTASAAIGVAGPAWADGGDAAAGLFGGMMLGTMMSESRNQGRREDAYRSGYSAGQAQQQQPRTVYIQQQPAQQPAQPALPAAPSAEQRMTELKSLHSKGLISDSEYQARRKQILDSL